MTITRQPTEAETYHHQAMEIAQRAMLLDDKKPEEALPFFRQAADLEQRALDAIELSNGSNLNRVVLACSVAS